MGASWAGARAWRSERSRLVLFGLAYLGFVSLGLPDGLLGVAWPSIRATFGLPLDALGALLVTFTVGYLASSFLGSWLLSRIGVGTLLALSCLATAVTLTGYGLVAAWWMVVALGVLAGLGAGAIDAGLNTFAATRFDARTVNWLHACYGVGAAIGPAIMTHTLATSGSWQRGYVIVGLGQLALAVCFGWTRTLWSRSTPPRQAATEPRRATTPVLATLRLPVVWLSLVVFFVYTGIEAAAGTWVYSLFTEARGVSMEAAGMWVSVYWAGLATGRLLSGALVSRVPTLRLLRGCMLGLAIGAGLIWLGATSPLSFLGLALMGLAAAPIFPTLVATTPIRLGTAHAANAIGFEIGVAVLGQSLLPAAVGVLARGLGMEAIGGALLVAALVLSVSHETLTALSVAPLRGYRAAADRLNEPVRRDGIWRP